jgi:catechol 2,3-dioxygenase-like lactoylglutathione lyase family enzyme
MFIISFFFTVQITLSSLFVSSQEKALRFYTEVLGFVVKDDIPMGPYRWLTVVSAEQNGGTELVLEPNDNPILNWATQAFQKALYEKNIPFTVFLTADIAKEYAALQEKGVVFTQPPTHQGLIMGAMFDDTCGNLISLVQVL